MDRLTLFGLLAGAAMLVCYSFEKFSPWWVLAFGLSCLLRSVYEFLQGEWPFALVEAALSLSAINRWWVIKHRPGALLVLHVASRRFE
jgi:hypothetical protein